jgi:hypothetical protein
MSFPKNEWLIHPTFVQEPVHLWCTKATKGEAARQPVSEQSISAHLCFDRACMKVWHSLNRNPANRWSESCPLWSSFPVAYVTIIFLRKLLKINGLWVRLSDIFSICHREYCD